MFHDDAREAWCTDLCLSALNIFCTIAYSHLSGYTLEFPGVPVLRDCFICLSADAQMRSAFLGRNCILIVVKFVTDSAPKHTSKCHLLFVPAYGMLWMVLGTEEYFSLFSEFGDKCYSSRKVTLKAKKGILKLFYMEIIYCNILILFQLTWLGKENIQCISTIHAHSRFYTLNP